MWVRPWNKSIFTIRWCAPHQCVSNMIVPPKSTNYKTSIISNGDHISQPLIPTFPAPILRASASPTSASLLYAAAQSMCLYPQSKAATTACLTWRTHSYWAFPHIRGKLVRRSAAPTCPAALFHVPRPSVGILWPVARVTYALMVPLQGSGWSQDGSRERCRVTGAKSWWLSPNTLLLILPLVWIH